MDNEKSLKIFKNQTPTSVINPVRLPGCRLRSFPIPKPCEILGHDGTVITMGTRSYYTFKGSECTHPDYEARAISALTQHQVNNFTVEATQMYAWREELKALSKIGLTYPDSTISLEYMIPRMGKRVDAVVLIGGYIFIVEFKVGERRYPSEAANQVTDYAFDLKNFHSGSADRSIFPVIVCTDAPDDYVTPANNGEGICCVLHANAWNLLSVLDDVMRRTSLAKPELDHCAWLGSVYKPTPTIVEAAQALYQRNAVEDISRNEAGLTNIATTTECVNDIIRHSKTNSRKSICFITGVPGAGKTLVGLNLAATRHSKTESYSDEGAVFLSGNGPLISVLQAALAEDQVARNKTACQACKSSRSEKQCKGCIHKRTKAQIDAEVKTFVQGVHLFREELFVSDAAPHEHIAVFDEAQRAWTENWLSFKMGNRRQNKREVHKSEPRCLIEYMDRHQDWACMICLVGGGQEINQGEAGIIEWFEALHDHFPDWDVYVSNEAQGTNYLDSAQLRLLTPNAITVEALHLAVDMRSFRNKNVAAFAEALVTNDSDKARELYPIVTADYPIYVTRDLNAAKEWVRRETRRPSDRYGIVADSYGQRIRADGIIVPIDFDAVKWFLRGKEEIDSSYYMEIAASEFKIQGLEIDYAVVAWEGDYRYQNGEFEFHRFYGGKWQNVRNEMGRRYLRNGYRVLLTRARQGYVIYVPKGSNYDKTRKPEFYDETYEYLITSGISELPELEPETKGQITTEVSEASSKPPSKPINHEPATNIRSATSTTPKINTTRKSGKSNTRQKPTATREHSQMMRRLRSAGMWFFVKEYEIIRNWSGSNEDLLEVMFAEGFDSKPRGTNTRISCTKSIIKDGQDKMALQACREAKVLASQHPEAPSMARALLEKYF